VKRFQFRLATVLRLRRAELEQARLGLAEANARLHGLLIARDTEARRYHLAGAASSAVTVDQLAAERHDASIALERLGFAERRAAEAANAAAIAQITWLTAHRRVAVLERLEERRKEEHLGALAREEIAVIDDLTTARFVAERRS